MSDALLDRLDARELARYRLVTLHIRLITEWNIFLTEGIYIYHLVIDVTLAWVTRVIHGHSLSGCIWILLVSPINTMNLLFTLCVFIALMERSQRTEMFSENKSVTLRRRLSFPHK